TAHLAEVRRRRNRDPRGARRDVPSATRSEWPSRALEDDHRLRAGGKGVSCALVLEDGEVFAGQSAGAVGVAFGEAVFATAMTGYQELVTDPSYAEQILCFTAPMVGNYGVADDRSESDRIHVRGVVMREARGPEWTHWLAQHGVVALTGVDTRSLVLHLRETGSQRAAIATRDADLDEVR